MRDTDTHLLCQGHPTARTCPCGHRELQLELCYSFWEHLQAQLGPGGIVTVPLPQEPALSLPQALEPLQELPLG